ncbi:MAG: hypothetical protein ACR2QH_15350 [Geminicoccaceae bacterium]
MDTQISQEQAVEPPVDVCQKGDVVIQEILPPAPIDLDDPDRLPSPLEKVWPYVEDMIRKAILSSDLLQKLETPKDVFNNLMANNYGLWVILADGGIKAAITMGIERKPRAQICKCYLCGGTEIERWMGPFYDYIIEQARNADCRFLQFEGRSEAWERLLKPYKFQKTSETFTLEI